jgi:phosphoesterase RecJ-like protein
MSGKIINLSELKEKIIKANNILIISHINPDLDTIGSALGLKWIFSKLGKTAYVICDMEINQRICGIFDIKPKLDGKNITNITDIKNKNFDYIICVDIASESMLGKNLEKYKDNIDLVIDHHYTNTLYGHETYLDEKAAAAGEIIYDLAKEFELEITGEFAKNIYCAIVGDTGSFRYSSTKPKTMRITAELIETGFDFAKLNRLIFENKSLEQIAVERLAYNSLQLYSDGKIAILNITQKLKKEAGLENAEIEGITDIPRMITGVEVGVLIKEIDEIDEDKLENKNGREFKISLRSNDYVNVAEIAAQFGGGGHIRAAGCQFKAESDLINPAEYIEKLIIEKITNLL